MVLTTRPMSLFSSRAPSFVASASRSCPWRAALHTRARPPSFPGGATFRASKFGPLLSTRLLTTRREKVKVLAVLYDGGVHAEQVRKTPPSLFTRGWNGMRGIVQCPCVTVAVTAGLARRPRGSGDVKPPLPKRGAVLADPEVGTARHSSTRADTQESRTQD